MAGEKKTEEIGDDKPLVNKIIDTVVDAAASYVKGVAADGAENLEKKARSTRLGKAAVALADQAEKATTPRGVSKKANTLAKSKSRGATVKKAKKKTAKKATKKSSAKKSSAKKSSAKKTSAKKSGKKAVKKTAKKKTAKKAKKSRR